MIFLHMHIQIGRQVRDSSQEDCCSLPSFRSWINMFTNTLGMISAIIFTEFKPRWFGSGGVPLVLFTRIFQKKKMGLQ